MEKKDFEVAHEIARQLVSDDTDVNEASKALEYLILCEDKNEFLVFLRKIIDNGSIVIRSDQTLGYYRNILRACNTHLKDYNNYKDMANVLGWAIRLMRYYRASGYIANAEKTIEAKDDDKQKPDQKGSSYLGNLLMDAMKKKNK
ncbi:TPA: hypothetical protein ENS27_17955 [bacterium]|nr:hypothetical protein [bacterium]